MVLNFFLYKPISVMLQYKANVMIKFGFLRLLRSNRIRQIDRRTDIARSVQNLARIQKIYRHAGWSLKIIFRCVTSGTIKPNLKVLDVLSNFDGN